MSDPRLIVLYGSETGCAEEASEKVVSEALRRGCGSVWWIPADELPLVQWSAFNCPIIIVCSTAGQGEFPLTMRKSWEQLRLSDAPEMNNLRYAVFGLGDSTYEKFNYAAKLLHNRLKQLGGEPILHRGLGDDLDPAGYDEALDPWMEALWKALEFPSAPSLTRDQLAPRWSVNVTSHRQPSSLDEDEGSSEGKEEGTTQFVLSSQSSILRPASQQIVMSTVITNRRLTAEDHFQDVRHIELRHAEAAEPSADRSGKSPMLEFEAGDALGVYPSNPHEEVEKMLVRCGLHPEDIVAITPRTDAGLVKQPTQPFFGHPIAAKDLFGHYLGITATGNRRMLRLLSSFATDEETKERLEELADPQNIDQFNSYCHREKRSFCEILGEFSSIALPLDMLVSALPPLRPRYFSIASSPAVASEHIDLTVAVLRFKTPYGREREGLCSAALAAAIPNETVFQTFTFETKMRLPMKEITTPDGEEKVVYSKETPLLLIGPGTGIAPLRGLIRHAFDHCHWKSPVHLFNGCRFKSKDHLYGEEWKALQESTAASTGSTTGAESGSGSHGGIFVEHTAFSRDQAKKQYVHHLMVQRPTADLIAELIVHKNAHICLCGNSKQMPVDINNSLASILATLGHEGLGIAPGDEAAAKKYLNRLQSQGRYRLDTWSV